ncbi:MAG: hypothetical protein JWM53_6717, partial [bacterium]|nr:hypothetical protein [bacterium]
AAAFDAEAGAEGARANAAVEVGDLMFPIVVILARLRATPTSSA